MRVNVFKTTGILIAAAFVLTSCSFIQKEGSARSAAEVSDDDTVAAMEEIAGIVMSGTVTVEKIVAKEPGAAIVLAVNASSSAVITSINSAKRIVTLQTREGKVQKFTAGPAIQRFDQLQVGNTVTVNYTEIMAVYLGQELSANTDTVSGLATKEDGTPGAALFGKSRITLKVLEFDKAARRVKLELPDTSVQEATVRDGIDLSQVKVGDTVTAAIAKALVIEVAQ